MAVDHRDFAVHAAQTVATETELQRLLAINEHFRAAAQQVIGHFRREKIAAAKAVDDDTHYDVALCRAAQRRRDALSRRIVGEDVGF